MRFLTLCLAFLVAACTPAESGPPPARLVEGVEAIVNMDGQIYDLSVSQVEGEIATVDLRWQDQLVTSRRLYRGLYPVSSVEGNARWVNEFDYDEVDALFPLAVGNEVTFETSLRINEPAVTGRNWVVMTVTGQSTMRIRDGEYEVFVIDIITEAELRGRRFTYTRQVHYAPALGMMLKMVMVENNVTSYWRVMSLTLPKGRPARERRNQLGTVAI